MKKLRITLNGQSYDVTVEEIKDGATPVTTPKVTNPAPVVKNEPVKEAPKVQTKVTDGETTVVSPMPGTILDVRCSAGNSVKAGDILFILEAMKMENEIVAPCDGTVSSVAVNKGASVGTDDLLATIK